MGEESHHALYTVISAWLPELPPHHTALQTTMVTPWAGQLAYRLCCAFVEHWIQAYLQIGHSLRLQESQPRRRPKRQRHHPHNGCSCPYCYRTLTWMYQRRNAPNRRIELKNITMSISYSLRYRFHIQVEELNWKMLECPCHSFVDTDSKFELKKN